MSPKQTDPQTQPVSPAPAMSEPTQEPTAAAAHPTDEAAIQLPADAEAPASATSQGHTTAPGETPTAAQVSESLQAAIDQAVKAAEAKIRDEYEAPGGHIAKLKSKLERRLAEERARQVQQSQASIEQALRLAEENPAQAIQTLASQLQAYHQREQVQAATSQLMNWAAQTAERLGLNPDAEEVQETIRNVDLTNPNAAFEIMGELSTLSVNQAQAQTKKATKALEDLQANLQEQAQQAVNQALANIGALNVDGSDVAPPPRRTENPIAEITNPAKLLSMGLADPHKKGGRSNRR